jgi:DNA-binding winged helix-turn-helix (wHTH) protein
MHLLRNRERVVSKSDLVEVVWSGRAISDSTLTSHINAARKAVADSGEEQRLIRTLPRKGYRFVGEVMEVRPRESKAVSAVEEQLRMLHPTLRIAQIKDWILLRRPEDTITFTEGLRQAGLPA